MKIDPIIAVKDVPKTSAWYQAVFNWKSLHGGHEFDVLATAEGEIMLCLHKWEAHEHPTMRDPSLTPGNGLILYFRAADMEGIRQNVAALHHPVEAEIAVNPNSGQREFSMRDPEGYYLMIAEFHRYGA